MALFSLGSPLRGSLTRGGPSAMHSARASLRAPGLAGSRLGLLLALVWLGFG